MRSAIRWSVWLCLSLMLWTAAAESTHNHPSQAAAASCTICVVAHSANPTPHSSQSQPVFSTIGLLQEEAVVAKARFDFADSGIRGPPVL